MKNKQLWEIFKVNLMYSNPNETMKKRKKGKSLTQIANSTMITYFLTGLIFIGVFGLSMMFGDISKRPGTFTRYVGTFSLILVAQLLSTINTVFLQSKDLNNYLPLPVKIKTILAAKLLTIVMSVSSFAIPVCAVFIITAIKGEDHWLVALIVAILAFLLYFTSIFIVTAILTFLISQSKLFKKNYQLGTSILLGISTIAIIAGCAFLGYSNHPEANTDPNSISFLLPIFELLKAPFTVSALILWVAMFLISGLGLSYLNRFVTKHLFSITASVAKKKKRKQPQRGLTHQLVTHQLGLIKQPSFLTQVFSNTFLMPIIFSISFGLGSQIKFSQVSNNYFAVFILLGLVLSAMTFNPSSLVGNIISLDGENLNFIKSLPVSFYHYLRVKFFFALAFQTVIMILLGIILTVFERFPLVLAIGLQIGMIAGQLIGSLHYFKRDFRFLTLNWTDANQLLTRGLGNWAIMIATFGSMIIGAIIMGLAFFLTGLIPLTINVLVVGILVLVTWLIQRHYQKHFWRQFKN
ncbi:hypothetical protein R4B61_02695 [Fructilactobacillus vespulae]|uniref:hypothetical protein n=1 Tax=Fructilactobacillus vespulae TaxID=1249630 RepID=UPI0039B5A4E3